MTPELDQLKTDETDPAGQEPSLTERLRTCDALERATLLADVMKGLGETTCKSILDLQPGNSIYKMVRAQLTADKDCNFDLPEPVEQKDAIKY